MLAVSCLFLVFPLDAAADALAPEMYEMTPGEFAHTTLQDIRGHMTPPDAISPGMYEMPAEWFERPGYENPTARAERLKQKAKVLESVWLYDEEPDARKMVDKDDEFSVYAHKALRKNQDALRVYGRDYARVANPGLADMPLTLADAMIESVRDESRRKQYRDEFDALGTGGKDTADSYYALYAKIVRDETRHRYFQQKEQERRLAGYDALLTGWIEDCAARKAAVNAFGAAWVSEYEIAGDKDNRRDAMYTALEKKEPDWDNYKKIRASELRALKEKNDREESLIQQRRDEQSEREAMETLRTWLTYAGTAAIVLILTIPTIIALASERGRDWLTWFAVAACALLGIAVWYNAHGWSLDYGLITLLRWSVTVVAAMLAYRSIRSGARPLITMLSVVMIILYQPAVAPIALRSGTWLWVNGAALIVLLWLAVWRGVNPDRPILS